MPCRPHLRRRPNSQCRVEDWTMTVWLWADLATMVLVLTAAFTLLPGSNYTTGTNKDGWTEEEMTATLLASMLWI